jgi:hypothetical protein
MPRGEPLGCIAHDRRALVLPLPDPLAKARNGKRDARPHERCHMVCPDLPATAEKGQIGQPTNPSWNLLQGREFRTYDLA